VTDPRATSGASDGRTSSGPASARGGGASLRGDNSIPRPAARELPKLGRSPSGKILIGVTVALAVGLGFVPALGGPGYEIALASGLVLPSVVAVLSAAEIDRHHLEPFDAFCRGVANGALAFTLLAVITLLHGLRVGFCDPLQGIEFMLLGPGIGACLAGAWGAVAAEASRLVTRRFVHGGFRTVVALAGPIGCIFVGLWRFYSSPMIFGFDPFVGFFSGALYDTVLDTSRLRSYRLGSALTLASGFVLSLHLTHDKRGHLVYQSIKRPGILVFGVLAAAGSIAHSLAGSELGHWHTRSSISERLGAVIEGDRCRVVYPRAMRLEDAQRFARECDAHVVANEAYLGVAGPPKITAFLFDSASQKEELMGAAGTNIAKPWRAEIYVQRADYPHRVLGHELAHVVAGTMGRGPFKIAGSVGGILPNPGLIEGVAVATSPKEDDLSPMEWAKAMKDLGLLPKLDRLFALGFFGENSSTAYMVSGAFVGWIHDHYGAAAVRDWYGGKALPEIVGKSWSDLEADWYVDLDKIALDDSAKELARSKFDKPGFFARKCPRLVDGCRERASTLSSAGDSTGALKELEIARSYEPENPALRMDVADAYLDASDTTAARETLTAIATDASMAQGIRDRAIEKLGDISLQAGEASSAELSYRDALSRTLDEGRARTLEVKIAAAKDEGLRPAVVALLLGVRGRGPDRTIAAELLGGLERERPADGLPPYLLGRYYSDVGDWAGAADHFDRALTRKITVPRVRLEALRQRIVAACALGDVVTAQKLLVDFQHEPGARAPRVDFLTRLVARTGGSIGPDAASAPSPPAQLSANPE